MKTTSRKPDSVSSVNITPLAPMSERTMCCTPTDRATEPVVEVLVHAVGDRPVVVERGEDVVQGLEEARQAADVEEGLLLAGEGGLRQVLGGRRRAHGDDELARVSGGHLRARRRVICSTSLPGSGACEDPARGSRCPCAAELLDVVHVEAAERGVDAVRQAVLRQELPVGVGRGGKAVGHPQAEGRQLAEQLAQGGVLAAHPVHVAHPQRAQGNHAGIQVASSIATGHDPACCPAQC